MKSCCHELLAAVDSQHLTAHEVGERGGEELDGAGDFVGAGVAHQGVFIHRGHELRLGLAGGNEACAQGAARGDHVHGDAKGAQLLGETARIVGLPRLRGGVDDTFVGALEAHHRADVDDATTAAGDHSGYHPAAAQQGGGEVAVGDRVQVFGGERERVVALGFPPGGRNVAACVVHQQVDGAELLLDPSDGGVHRLRVAEVTEDGDDRIAGRSRDLFGDAAGGRSFVELLRGLVGAPVHRH